MLMNASTTTCSLEHVSSRTKKDQMYNDVVDMTVTIGMSFKKCDMKNGKTLVLN